METRWNNGRVEEVIGKYSIITAITITTVITITLSMPNVKWFFCFKWLRFI
jgi:hypothetical protein